MRSHVWNPWHTAREAPGRLAVVAGESQCTFGELTTRADQLGEGLRSIGISDGAVVTTDLPAGPEFFALALAALRYGYGLFPINGDDLTDFGDELRIRAGAVLHVGAESLAPNWVSDADLIELAKASRLEQDDVPVPQVRAGFLVLATAGTTGVPKTVVRARPWYPYKGVAVLPQYAAGMLWGPHLMANPSFHLGTLGPALYALQAGSAVVVQQTWSTDGLIDLIDQYHTDSAFLSPDRLIEVVASARWSRYRPTVVFHGGSACPEQVKRAAIELMGPVLHEYYGISESVLTEIASDEWLQRPGSVGRALAGIRIDVISASQLPSDHPNSSKAGEIGEIWATLRLVDRDSSDEVRVSTGDLGYVDSDGYLYVLGRAESRTGETHAFLENNVRRLPGVADTAVIMGHPVTCLVEVFPNSATIVGMQIEQLARQCGLDRVEVNIQPVGTLPRTPSGKLRRAKQ